MLGVVQNERKGKQWEQWEQWEQGKKKTRGHGDARTRGAAGHTDLRTEISRVRVGTSAHKSPHSSLSATKRSHSPRLLPELISE
ncbi:MAG: hypothetical protein BRC34_00020 [Cyanobacteria bacterium QH_1_48_107]|nr:MAG: hypothetical protein BRC34_00020 [Cyanobacteria bacterium QH_1_48_107]